jgi:hypothetical protein
MTAEELAMDLVDGFHDNIDGEPAVEAEGIAWAAADEAECWVRFDDGTSFNIIIRRV